MSNHKKTSVSQAQTLEYYDMFIVHPFMFLFYRKRITCYPTTGISVTKPLKYKRYGAFNPIIASFSTFSTSFSTKRHVLWNFKTSLNKYYSQWKSSGLFRASLVTHTMLPMCLFTSLLTGRKAACCAFDKLTFLLLLFFQCSFFPLFPNYGKPSQVCFCLIRLSR